MHLHGGRFHKIYTTHKRTAGLQQLAQSSRMEHGSASMAGMVLPQWPAWFCLNGLHGSASMAGMVLPQWPAWFCLNGRHGSASMASMVLPLWPAWCCLNGQHGSASVASMVLPQWPAWCCLNGQHGSASVASIVLPQWPAWCCLNGQHGSASVASMVLPQGSVRWFGGKLWSSKGAPCCPAAVLAALLHGATAAFWLLCRGGRTGDCGPVWFL